MSLFGNFILKLALSMYILEVAGSAAIFAGRLSIATILAIEKRRGQYVMFPEKLALVAKRENNTKRNYLVVNKYQGKHIPVNPSKALEMFSALAGLLENRFQGERLLLIGFAETATAIGEALAVQLGSDYMQTTREAIKEVEYLYFSESHSHATEQKVVKDDLDAVILGMEDAGMPLPVPGQLGILPSAAAREGADAKAHPKAGRIVFVEDEVTTGNTIWEIIQLMRQEYGDNLRFSVASLLNGMDGEAQEKYRRNGIDMVYLVKTDHSCYPELAERCVDDGIYHKCQPFCGGRGTEKDGLEVKGFSISGYINARRLHKGADYQAACRLLWQGIKEKIPFGAGQDILVLGTEEFMYAPLYVAQRIQELGNHVKCHATTRSPIMVSKNPGYPLHERYELVSLYDAKRITYLYDLAEYDIVLVITDAEPSNGQEDNFQREYRKGDACLGEPGMDALCNAICSCGNKKIYFVRWCGD